MLRGLLAFALIAQFGQVQTRDNPASKTGTSTIAGGELLRRGRRLAASG
jgi:hypothetical protein